jgi:hypothetical protein
VKILDRVRNRSSRGQAGSAEASSADEQRLPIARYDQLDGKQVVPQLSQLSQVELAAVEAGGVPVGAGPPLCSTSVAARSLSWLVPMPVRRTPSAGYPNLNADPRARVQIRHTIMDVRAQAANGEEREARGAL